MRPSSCQRPKRPRVHSVSTAKGTSAFLVPVANMIKTATGGWQMVFVVTAIVVSELAARSRRRPKS